jgi:hypothetical protein
VFKARLQIITHSRSDGTQTTERTKYYLLPGRSLIQALAAIQDHENQPDPRASVVYHPRPSVTVLAIEEVPSPHQLGAAPWGTLPFCLDRMTHEERELVAEQLKWLAQLTREYDGSETATEAADKWLNEIAWGVEVIQRPAGSAFLARR